MIETLDIETLDLRRQEQEEFLAERRLSGVAQSSWRQRSAHTVQSAWATRLAPDTQAVLRAAAVLAEAVTEAALTAVAGLPRAGCALVSAERPREPATPWPPNPGRNTAGPIRALATIMSEWRPRWCRAGGWSRGDSQPVAGVAAVLEHPDGDRPDVQRVLTGWCRGVVLVGSAYGWRSARAGYRRGGGSGCGIAVMGVVRAGVAWDEQMAAG